MDFGDFKTICFMQGIDPKLIDACQDFINQHDYMLIKDRTIHPETSLGYAECADITTLEQGLSEIKQSIMMSTIDYDSRGRSLEKIRMKQLIQNPNKAFKRIVLKTFYLANGSV